MMEHRWQTLSEHLRLSDQSRERVRARLAAQPTQQEDILMKKKILPLRGPLIAAALAAVMAITVSATSLLGVLDLLKKQDSFSLLGMTQVYEECAYDVGISASTPRGDVFTLEKAATDSTFCTIFYTYRYAQPQMTQEEFAALDAHSPWDAYSLAPQMELLLNGERISAEGYNNSFEVQQYFSDPSTICGAWRCLLDAPSRAVGDGAQLELQGWIWNEEAREREEFALSFISHPCSSSINTPGVTFSMYRAGRPMEVEAASLSRSPLGSLLTLRYEKDPNNGLGLDGAFVLRNKDTGAYIPFARVWTMKGADSAGMLTDTYELFGTLDDLNVLELIPVWHSSGISERTVVPLSSLPWLDLAHTSDGYAPASYRIADGGRLIVEMKPIGPSTSHYSSIGNGVNFLDKDGNDPFQSTASIEKFKDRATGIITVVVTFQDLEDFEANVDKVTALWFFANDYTLLEEQAVTIPLPLSLEK